MSDGQKYYGKYRGMVLNNVDPLQIGRLMVQVPDVGGLIPSSWAMPCFPISGKQMGAYMIPQIGAGVWVEFEQGDADYPIWSGCWYGSAAEVPALALAGNPASPSIVLQTGLPDRLDRAGGPRPGVGEHDVDVVVALQQLTRHLQGYVRIHLTVDRRQDR